MTVLLPPCAHGYRPVDRRGIRVEARSHPKEQAGSDDEDRTRGRIGARGVGEIRKAARAHAHGEPQRGEKLALRCLYATATSGSELRACQAGGLECWRLRVDPLAQVESSSSCFGVREARHPMCAHAVRKRERLRVCRADRLVRGPAGGERDRATDRSEAAPDVAFTQLSHLVAGCTLGRITAPSHGARARDGSF